jgi:hypothetical protein
MIWIGLGIVAALVGIWALARYVLGPIVLLYFMRGIDRNG